MRWKDLVPFCYRAIPVWRIRFYRFVFWQKPHGEPPLCAETRTATTSCLDIGGNLLPNVFVDRSGADSDAAVRDVSDLVASAGKDESVLIYRRAPLHPEKARRLSNTPPTTARAVVALADLLPPRLGGVSAMLEKNPGKDLVFLAHVDLRVQLASTISSAAGLKQRVILQFWRISYHDLPTGDPTEFLFAEWDKMQSTVDALKTELAT